MTTFGGSLEEKSIPVGGARFVEKYDWKQPNRLLVAQKGESVNQAKVFRAHAVGVRGFHARELKKKKPCACDCGRGLVSVGALFFLFFFSHQNRAPN